MNRKPTVLLVDDEPFVLDSLSAILSEEGFDTLQESGGHAAFERLRKEPVDAVVTDLSMDAGGGLDLLGRARDAGLGLPILILTGVGKVPDAVAAMKRGAYDFLQKPVDPDLLLRLLRHALDQHELERRVRDLRGPREDCHLLGASAPMQRLRETLAQAAPTDTPVLLRGESGAGKDAAARELHRLSERSDGQLVRVHATSLPPDSFERELCGSRGLPDGESQEDRPGLLSLAQGGTLVLDRLGAFPLSSQELVARVLEEECYTVAGEGRPRALDARLVTTTSEDLAARVERGELLPELFYRVNVFPVDVPPLRERKEDLAELAEHFLRTRGIGEPLTEEALEVLRSYDWPGNVRELENVMERGAIVSSGAPPEPGLLQTILESGPSAPAARGADAFHLRSNLDATERRLVIDSLKHSGGVKKDACALLGIDPRNLGYYLRKHRISKEELDA